MLLHSSELFVQSIRAFPSSKFKRAQKQTLIKQIDTIPILIFLLMQTLQCQPNLIEIEQTLSKYAYFSRSPLPGFADGVIYRFLSSNKKYPDKKKYPHFYHWYIIMRQFHDTAFEGWIREKRYVDNQSQKCLMLISQIFAKHDRRALQVSNRKKSLDTSMKSLNPQKSLLDSARFKPVDQDNSHLKSADKTQYKMIVQVRSIENIEEFFNRFYKLKIKIKELNFTNKKKQAVYLRFNVQKSKFEEVKEEIQNWIQVRHSISKESRHRSQKHDNKKLQRALSIR